ncbi:MAG: hypothetical protein N2C13_05790, partial [Chloroflexota bacterium]
MRFRRSYSLQRIISLFFIVAAVILLTVQLIAFSRGQSRFSDQMLIAGIPVGGLNRQEVAQRLLEVYST